MQNKPYPALPCKWFILTLIIFGLIATTEHYYNSWDFKNYHWYNAYAFLYHRMGFDIDPAQMQNYFNPLLDAFNYVVIKLLVFPPLFEFFFGALSGITAWYIIKIALRFFSDAPATLYYIAISCAVLIGVTDPGFISQMGAGFIDAEVAIFVIIAFYCALKVLDASTFKAAYVNILLTGFLLGCAMGFKLTSTPFVCGIFGALCLAKRPTLIQFYLLSLFIVSFLIGFTLIEGFWMFYMYRLFHNPFFPLFNDIFRSPDALSYSYEQAPNKYFPQTLSQWLFYPFYWLKQSTLVTESPMRNARLAILILITALVCIKYIYKFKRKKTISQNASLWRFLCLFLIISYIAWLYKFSIYRYFIPVPLLSGIAIIGGLLYLGNCFSFKTQKLFMIAVTILSIITASYPNWGRIHSFKVTIPALPDNSYVILYDNNPPQAYLASFFPKSVRFISPQNNFMDLNNNTLLQHQANSLINNYQGPLYAIDYPASRIDTFLAYYHLEIVKNSCQSIVSTLEKDPRLFSLCLLKRN